MIILFLISCAFHKTNLTGIVDYAGHNHCAVEISVEEVIVLKSEVCKRAKEGDTIYFYGRLK